MKILFIHDYPPVEGGGVEVSTFADAKALKKEGYDVSIATTRLASETVRSGRLDSDFVEGGVRIYYLDSYQKLKTCIDSADVIHVQATFSLREGTMAALRMLRDSGKVFFVGLRTTIRHLPFSYLSQVGNLAADSLLHEFAQILTHENCIITAPSRCLKESLDKLGVKKELVVVHNARDWENQSFSRASNIERFGPVDISYIGEISWMKGLHVLLGALSILSKTIPGVKVRFVGGGQNKRDLLALAKSLKQNISFEFLDYKDNASIGQVLASTRVLVMPSFTESWGNIAMEAMAMGVPVVASDVEGLVELTRNGEDSILFEMGDPKDLADKLAMVLLDEKVAAKYSSENIINYVKTMYSMKERVSTLLGIYNLSVNKQK